MIHADSNQEQAADDNGANAMAHKIDIGVAIGLLAQPVDLAEQVSGDLGRGGERIPARVGQFRDKQIDASRIRQSLARRCADAGEIPRAAKPAMHDHH
jgi:hypothetical protein